MGTALGFELLDRHVVAGRSDLVACSDESGDLTGGLWSVPPGGGEPTLLSADLQMPGGIAVGEDGTVYVTTGASIPNAGTVVSWKP